MADLIMTYSSLETTADKFNEAKSDLDSVISYLTNAISALQGQYSGQSYEALVEAWQTSKPTMENLSQAISAFAPQLKTTVADQQERETAAATGMRNLGF